MSVTAAVTVCECPWPSPSSEDAPRPLSLVLAEEWLDASSTGNLVTELGTDWWEENSTAHCGVNGRREIAQLNVELMVGGKQHSLLCS